MSAPLDLQQARSVSLDAVRLSRHRRRKLVNRVALALSLAAMAFGVFWLIWILIDWAGLSTWWAAGTPPPQRRSRSPAAPLTMSRDAVASKGTFWAHSHPPRAPRHPAKPSDNPQETGGEA